MKLLIFSDNHRDILSLKEILKQNPDMDRYISLGDSEMREHQLTELNVFGVRGNYPFEPKFPYELNFNFQGVNIFLTHGHLYGVKMGLSRLLNKAIYENYNIVCFGHTHKPLLKELKGVVFLNPGSLSLAKSGASQSYALISINDESIEIVIKTVSGKIVKEYTKKR